MKRLMWAWLGVAGLVAALPSQGSAQGVQYIFTPGGDCIMSPELWKSLRGAPREGEDKREFERWLAQFLPSDGRYVISNVLVGIHPMFGLLPTQAFVELHCDHPAPLRGGLRVVEDNGITTNGVVGGQPFSSYGVTCPFLAPPDSAPGWQPVGFPEVLTNLNRLVQADRLLKLGEELCLKGRFAEAVNCFQEVHRLVPGTNLEARAGAATAEAICRVYGTASENGVVDEQSEVVAPAPACPEGPHCAKGKCSEAKTPFAANEAAPKPRTIVYPVTDLLGKGKEACLDDLDDLVGVIEETIDPRSWASNGGPGTIDYYYRSRALIVNQTPEIHEQIAELLAGLRQAKAQSDAEKRKSGYRPSEGRAAKANADGNCCDECCPVPSPREGVSATPSVSKKCCEDCCSGCCFEFCLTPVLTLPEVPADEAKTGGPLKLVIEGCNEESAVMALPKSGLCCSAFGLCAEASTATDGLQFRWQMPLGPVTLLVRYEHQTLTVDIDRSEKTNADIEKDE